jgi:hypothetical protein
VPSNRLMMLDSGAYTVWSQGKVIEVEDYVAFCLEHPNCSYYVNLDVIAGVPHGKQSPDMAEAAAEASWQNYLHMIQELPKEKVIPVYHYGASVKHLVRMLEFGCPYIGLGGSAHKATPLRVRWLRGLRKYLFTGAGRAVTKLHGFAVTSYDLMKVWEWHSVDSASWKDFANYGAIYLPIERGGAFDYSTKPLVVFMTPQSTKRDRQQHFDTMSPGMKDRMRAWLASCGVTLGTTEYFQKDDKYKLDVPVGELWFDKKKRVMMRPVPPEGKGVTNSFEMRAKVNAKFVARSNPVLPVNHIYFAGQVMPHRYNLEFQLKRRLLSYYYTSQNDYALRHFEEHLRRIAEGI